MMITSRKMLRMAGIQVISAPHRYRVSVSLSQWVRLVWRRIFPY